MAYHECFAIIFLRDDGTPASRADYYPSRAAAERAFAKSTSIHGAHPNGSPRWRLAHMTETVA